MVTHKAFTQNNWSRDGSNYWYRCSVYKATGCTATAVVKILEEEESAGMIVVKNYLL